MQDTAKEIEQIHREMLMCFSGEERLKMGSSMFTSARRLMLARLQTTIVDPIELQVQFFEQTYSDDFSVEQRSKIADKIRSYWQGRF